MAEVLVGLITVFESLFNTAAFVDTCTGTSDTAGVACADPGLTLATSAGLANLDSEFFTVLSGLLFTLPAALPETGTLAAGFNALTGALLTALIFFPDDTPEAWTVLFASVTAFTVTALAAALSATLATGLTAFFGAAALPATPLATTFAALTAVFGTGFATTFAGALAALLTAVFAAALVTVLTEDFFALLVVVIFEADSNFRLAAFFSVALDFVKIFFALEATTGFAGFFML